MHIHYCSPLIYLDQWKRTCSVGDAASGSVHWDVHMNMWRTCVEVGEEEELSHLACSSAGRAVVAAAAVSVSHSIVDRLQSDSVVVVGKKNQSLHGMMMG